MLTQLSLRDADHHIPQPDILTWSRPPRRRTPSDPDHQTEANPGEAPEHIGRDGGGGGDARAAGGETRHDDVVPRDLAEGVHVSVAAGEVEVLVRLVEHAN